ncbi:MAG TPA: hypothetical protein PKM41_16505 [Deltaproteobacteria bacterium]|nr:hypothetical protein [Deltaproteobacteria bacterium]
MSPSPDLMIVVGSRSGALFALLFFGSLFGMLGWTLVREALRRGVSPAGARLLGVLSSVLPVLLIWFTSLSGFYGLTVSRDRVTLSYLAPFLTKTLPSSQVRQAEALTAFKLRWRVHLVLASGEEHESALTDRETAELAARLIRARVTGPAGKR